MSNVAQVVAQTVAGLGANHVFALMGGGNLGIIHHLTVDQQIPVHHLRHENAVIGAADGYARATGNVGWCTVTHGPGFTNAITALRTADMGRSPIVLITSDSSHLSTAEAPFVGGVQGLNPHTLLDPLEIATIRMGSDAPASDVCAAFQLARSRSCPVVLVVPVGLAGDTKSSAVQAALDSTLLVSKERPVPNMEQIAQAVDSMRASQSLVILAGRGAVVAGAEAALEELALLYGAVLATTIRAVGLFPDFAGSIGTFGGFSTDEAARVVDDADCILAVGASLNHLQTRRSQLLAGKTVIQIDDDPAAFGRHDKPDIAIHGDALSSVEALLSATRKSPSVPSRTRSPLTVEPFLDVSRPGELDPRAVSAEVDRLLPKRRTVVVDGGHFASFPIMHMKFTAADSLAWMSNFGAIGSALGASIGAAVGRPERQTVLFIGDCGLFMSLGDLEVAIRESIPLLVVCGNDGAAGSELVHLTNSGFPRTSAIFGTANLAAIASAMGAQAALISELDEIGRALSTWDSTRGPMLLDCRITREVRSPVRAHT